MCFFTCVWVLVFSVSNDVCVNAAVNVGTGHGTRRSIVRGEEWRKVMEATCDRKKDRRLPWLEGLRGDQGMREGGE